MQDQEEIKLSTEEKGWLGKTKDVIYENWQTILVALVVLIVGISAYNYNSKTNSNPSGAATGANTNTTQPASSATTATTDQEGSTQAKDQAAAATQDQTNKTAATDTAAKQTDTTKQTNTETKTATTNASAIAVEGANYKVTAVKGDGITHLARKALNQYLVENKDDQITALHKIYIEDYLQKQAGSEKINVGHTETFSKTTIQNAIAASKKLSQKSLDNLKKYETKA